MSLTDSAADLATPRFAVGTPRTPRTDGSSLGAVTLPPQSLKESLSHMDRLTQLQDKVEEGVTVRNTEEDVIASLPQLTISLKTAYDQARRNAQPLPVDSIPLPADSRPAPSQIFPPGANTSDRPKSVAELARDIAFHGRAIDLYIQSLPDVGVPEERQLEELRELDLENRKEGEELERVFEEARTLRDLARQAIRFIADDQNAYLKKCAEKKRRIVEAGVVGLGF
ncbi:hypothetical protein HDU93_007013 [Gonapodya sp. JEL0774]|nr:hypothetical protein HDU93_007013 [Gonapodya sp. JEL0774]